jgi:hypothetical protein
MIEFIENDEFYDWLRNAIDLDIYVGCEVPNFKDLREFLYYELPIDRGAYHIGRKKEFLKAALLNLWVAFQNGIPLMYSRDKNRYTKANRYGKLFFTHRNVTEIYDSLEAMGLVHQKIGFNDKGKFMTRVFPSDKLIIMFLETFTGLPGEIEKIGRDEVIVLKTEKMVERKTKKGRTKIQRTKPVLEYKDDERSISMRMRVEEYNGFIRDQDIRFEVPGDLPIKFSSWLYIISGIIKGSARLISLELNENRKFLGKNGNINKLIQTIANQNDYGEAETLSIKYPVTGGKEYQIKIDDFVINYLLSLHENLSRRYNTKKRRKVPFRLSDFGISKMIIEAGFEDLHRTFNKESFDLGGRFYGAFHLNLERNIRKNHTLINGNRTVELDYSALHPRMCYHKIDKDYREDPYWAACKTDSETERKMFKKVQLAVINAENVAQAIKGIRHDFYKRKEKYDIEDVKDQTILKLIDRFKNAHTPIERFLTSGAGLHLQNLDSIITDNILWYFLNQGIPVLPVHDSYIVEECYKGILEEKMVEFYERLMGFPPVIG